MSKRKTLIRIRKKPVKPKRLVNRILASYQLYDDEQLVDIIDSFENQLGRKVSMEEIYFKDSWDYDQVVFEAVIMGDEDDDSYNYRLAIWKEQVEKYEDWYKENEDLIEEELRLRELEKKSSVLKELEAARAKASDLEKKLKELI